MRSMKYFNASILPAGNEMESNAIAIANSQPPNLCLTNQSWLKCPTEIIAAAGAMKVTG